MGRARLRDHRHHWLAGGPGRVAAARWPVGSRTRQSNAAGPDGGRDLRAGFDADANGIGLWKRQGESVAERVTDGGCFGEPIIVGGRHQLRLALPFADRLALGYCIAEHESQSLGFTVGSDALALERA